MLLALAIAAATPVPDARLQHAVTQAIRDEIEYGIDATIDQDIERYMETVPEDYRIVEDDGSITDREALRRNQLQAWAIIPRTNALAIDVTRVEVGCDGECATVWTDQRWDRQMLGRDGASQHNVVTTQRHRERWEVRNSRWINTNIEELGGTVTVDGQPYN
ncbi:MAG TPA: hypothetical protein VLK25_05390 [Allosphingosinicella sp.]|nr:hypothetical protein [Allosphingosinicella sp.]